MRPPTLYGWPSKSARKERHGPTISYKEACELVCRSSLNSIIAMRDDAPEPKIKLRNKGRSETYYDKKEMVSWLKKLKAEGVIDGGDL